MPRSRDGVSVSRIFRDYFRENPEFLTQASNVEIYDRFKQEHPEIELTKAVQGVCANIKSIERKKLKDNGGVLPDAPPRPRGRPAKTTAAPTTSTAVTPAAPKVSVAASASPKDALTALEEQIDDVLNIARNLDKTGLEDVIRHLRRARNLVSLKLDS
ncbi:hypothetical protein [Tuwongella immobilis]|uniref:Uncharacterized protein n=1 Tax=Tuwongella immobilis TaxID=692036 RepID=A0A6C2YN11_9BACT|nr:hypothetical protein [Tuwongella immobilis]VIP02599.1 unnamed protein product [Tuwongella immobilis]VTS01885.1 unnamed protein product [Tuwongella immobilis]